MNKPAISLNCPRNQTLLPAILLFLIWLASAIHASAQTNDKAGQPTPIPRPPYLAAVPDYGHWTITFKYAPSGDASAGADTKPSTPPPSPTGFPTSIDTIKTGELRGVILAFADGTTRQFTCQGDWVLSSTPRGAVLSIASPSHLPYIYYTPGFILLDGIAVNASTYKEVQIHNGTRAFHYRSNDTDVWVDINTMLPLAVKTPGVEAAYQFLAPPPRPFLIPKDQADLLKKEQNAYNYIRSLR